MTVQRIDPRGTMAEPGTTDAHAGGGAYLSPPCEGGARRGGPQNLRIVSVFAVRT
jgi:hypothetical protein